MAPGIASDGTARHRRDIAIAIAIAIGMPAGTVLLTKIVATFDQPR
jgi:hypothetical protein